MEPGEWATRGTVWLALALYVAGEVARISRRGAVRRARWLNTMGCVAFLAHVACAFHFYHTWSHAAAYADTARQTAKLFGWNSGAGLYVNYLFAIVWLAEVCMAWAKPQQYFERAQWITWMVRGFFWFMIFNGAVVFVRGPMQALGWLLCGLLIGCWWFGRGTLPAPDQTR